MNTKFLKVGNCSNCKNSAAWNTPALDSNGHLWCSSCVNKNRNGILFKSVEQHLNESGYIFTNGIVFNGVVVWHDLSTWVEGGRQSVNLTEQEKKLSPIEIAILINTEYNVNGIIRCTGCNAKITNNQVAGYPLFSGVNCAPCWEKHNEHLKNQSARGHVCRRCKNPYDACYC